jgi:hypothetical protein
VRQGLSGLAVALIVGLGACVPSVALADAPTLPVFDGAMTFPDIQDSSGPEEFSWEVVLSPEQALEQVNDQLARVYYTDAPDVTAFGIVPVHAHDAVGATVPTTLSVPSGNVITLTVHHRDGNPAAGGAAFDYPVIVGEGWEGGFQTSVVQMPPAELLPVGREEVLASEGCLVPRLKSRGLRRSKKKLRETGCRIGEVTIRKGASAKTGRVVRQSPKPGTLLGPGAEVDVVLGTRD